MSSLSVAGLDVRDSYARDVAAIARIEVVPRILEVVCRTTGLGFSAVARVTEDRWIACAVRDEIAFGLATGGELRVETTICNEIRQSGRSVAIDHVAEDPVFRNHATPAMYGFQSYISVPITLADGQFFGTLCAIDPKPARVNTPETIGMLTLFASLIAMHLDTHERLARTETALHDARQRVELQNQFIAVLGHDLRNPLSAIQTSAKLLLATSKDEQVAHVGRVVDRSAARMGGLIENVLDFARGRLGSGLAVTRTLDSEAAAMIEQVVAEMQVSSPDRQIHLELHLDRPLFCDRSRIGQVLSNLLSNALTHGDPEGPVWIRAHSQDDAFELSVANTGEPIAPAAMERLFQPFTRAEAGPGRDGLGLGLYIASEIAAAHGGTLDVTSTADETRFTLRIPS